MSRTCQETKLLLPIDIVNVRCMFSLNSQNSVLTSGTFIVFRTGTPANRSCAIRRKLVIGVQIMLSHGSIPPTVIAPSLGAHVSFNLNLVPPQPAHTSSSSPPISGCFRRETMSPLCHLSHSALPLPSIWQAAGTNPSGLRTRTRTGAESQHTVDTLGSPAEQQRRATPSAVGP